MKKVGIYVHVPFCRAKCYYCDFVSYAGRREEEINAYLSALRQEGRLYRQRYTQKGEDDGNGAIFAQSLYIGGGTPTCLTSGQLSVLFGLLRELFHLPQGLEITVEANPGTIGRERLQCLHEVGCNRLSLGVQSFSPRELQVLGRIHRDREIFAGFEAARKAGFKNINLDLMYGLPGQSLADWRKNLRQAVALRPEHLSLYQLNIERETPFARLVDKGLLEEFDQDTAFTMYREAIDYLQGNGYHHYEISNFALPGRESYHNQIYWRNEEYLGLGAGAAGFLAGVRYRNTPAITAYIERLARGELPLVEEEVINEELSMAETMFLGLRLREGVNKEHFREKYGVGLEEKYGQVLVKLLDRGLLEETPTHIALSRKGLYVANLVMQEFLP